MQSFILRLLAAFLFCVVAFAAIGWLDSHLTVLLEDRLTQMLNEAVSGTR